MTALSKQVARIAALRRRLFAAKPGKEQLLTILDQAEVSEHVYNSNAIENSTLSLEENETILRQIDAYRPTFGSRYALYWRQLFDRGELCASKGRISRGEAWCLATWSRSFSVRSTSTWFTAGGNRLEGTEKRV